MSGPVSAPAELAAPLRSLGHAEVHRSEHGAALRIVAPELAAPAALDRVVAACGALLSGELSGVARVLDLVRGETGLWLVTAGPVGPSLRELLDSGAPVTKQGAAALLSDVALAALAVQGAGWRLHLPGPDCIVVDATGQAWVLDAPLHMTPPGAGAAASAPEFADLVERVAARWVPGGSFAPVAAAARTAGMGAALSQLMQVLAGQTATPDARASVRAALGGAPSVVPVAPVAPPPSDPAATQASARTPVIPAAQVAPAATMASARRFPPTELAATALGARADAGPAVRVQSAAGVFRFGPGVPPRNAVPAPTPVALAAAAPAQRRRGFATLVLLVAMAILLWWLLRPGPALSVGTVRAHGPARTLGCDSTADLRATVPTNGAAGTLTYHWVRSDSVRSGPKLERLVAGQHEAVLHLRWTVRGRGTYAGRATVTLDRPQRGAAAAGFRYACA